MTGECAYLYHIVMISISLFAMCVRVDDGPSPAIVPFDVQSESHSHQLFHWDPHDHGEVVGLHERVQVGSRRHSRFERYQVLPSSAHSNGTSLSAYERMMDEVGHEHVVQGTSMVERHDLNDETDKVRMVYCHHGSMVPAHTVKLILKLKPMSMVEVTVTIIPFELDFVIRSMNVDLASLSVMMMRNVNVSETSAAHHYIHHPMYTFGPATVCVNVSGTNRQSRNSHHSHHIAIDLRPYLCQ